MKKLFLIVTLLFLIQIAAEYHSLYGENQPVTQTEAKPAQQVTYSPYPIFTAISTETSMRTPESTIGYPSSFDWVANYITRTPTPGPTRMLQFFAGGTFLSSQDPNRQTQGAPAYYSLPLPHVTFPDWLNLSDTQKQRINSFRSEYEALQTSEKRAIDNEVEFSKVITLGNDLAVSLSDSDAAIPVLMMIGHLENKINEGLSPKYEEAIRLLIMRHPERIQPEIAEDLEDLGLTVTQKAAGPLDSNGTDAILLTFIAPNSHVGSKGRIFGFVREKNQSWVFMPLPTYIDSTQHDAWRHTVADINNDGMFEIITEQSWWYAAGIGKYWNVFAWENHNWVDRSNWQFDNMRYYGELETRDVDNDGISEIIIRFSDRGIPFSDSQYTVQLYRWDKNEKKYKYESSLPYYCWY